jgi:hypothetical protein
MGADSAGGSDVAPVTCRCLRADRRSDGDLLRLADASGGMASAIWTTEAVAVGKADFLQRA